MSDKKLIGIMVTHAVTPVVSVRVNGWLSALYGHDVKESVLSVEEQVACG